MNGSRVGGHAPGPVHTHPHPTSNNTFEPAAKRQRLSGDPPPKTYKTTWNAQHVAAHTEAALWPHAKAAADFIRDTEVDKGKLRSEVGNNSLFKKTWIYVPDWLLVIIRFKMLFSFSSAI